MSAINRRDLLIGAMAGAGLGLVIRPLPAVGAGSAQSGFPVSLSDAEWRRRLSPAAHAVLRQGQTERAGSSPLVGEHRQGTYHCAGCGNPVFSSRAKYDSGTGWPSFYAAIRGAIGTRPDRSLFVTRTEVHCRRCGGHLGHVFDDGPRPTGLRYCMNGLALRFRASR